MRSENVINRSKTQATRGRGRRTNNKTFVGVCLFLWLGIADSVIRRVSIQPSRERVRWLTVATFCLGWRIFIQAEHKKVRALK